MISRDARVNTLIGTGHFLSHFYQLCLPPLFFVWQREFGITFAELGLIAVLMASMILFSTLLGIFLGEWKGTSSRTRGLLALGLMLLLSSTVLAAYDIWQQLNA